MRPHGRYARVDPQNPEAFAQCDRCGFWYNLRDLVWQDQWAGTKLYRTGALVCRTGNRCYDKPQEQLRTIILPPDPRPVLNARVPNFLYEEQTARILEYNAASLPPWGAGPQILRALQDGETVRLLEFSSEDNIGRITDQSSVVSYTDLVGTEIMEIALSTGSQASPADGRLTNLAEFLVAPSGVEVMELIATGRGAPDGTTENATFVPLDGRLTSMQLFTANLAGTEVMELVMPNNSQTGQNYQITTALLAAFFSAYPYINTTIVVAGATLVNPFNIPTNTTRLLVNKTIASDSYLLAPLAASMLTPFPILIKDLAGNASTHPITISFSGGELCDGLSTLSLVNDYGWLTINPVPGGSAWYQS
jgi:hypothetical protein